MRTKDILSTMGGPNCTREMVATAELAFERARVVAVLDGWAKKYQWNVPTPGPTTEGWAVIVPNHLPGRGRYVGPTPDAARAAAAQAIEAGEV